MIGGLFEVLKQAEIFLGKFVVIDRLIVQAQIQPTTSKLQLSL